MVDPLKSAERRVAWASFLMLCPTMGLAVLEWSELTPMVLTAFILAGAGMYYLQGHLFLLGAGTALIGAVLLVPGPIVIPFFILGLYSLITGGQAVKLLREQATSSWSDSRDLSRGYLGSVLFLALEFLIGGTLTLLIVIASPIWHFPTWTVVELGVILIAVLSSLTYWVLRTKGSVQKV